MSRLIDADALLAQKGLVYDWYGHLMYAVGTGNIMAAPTVEAEPVRRGKWDKAQPRYPYTKESRKSFCSLCGNWGRKSFKYCPHCGARMEEE